MTKRDRIWQILCSVSLRIDNITSLESCRIITTAAENDRTVLKKPFLPSSSCEVEQGKKVQLKAHPEKGKPVATLQLGRSCSTCTAAQTLLRVQRQGRAPWFQTLLGVSSAAPHLSKAGGATALGVASPCTNYILKQRKEKENTENRLLRKGRFSLPYGFPLCCGSAYAKLLMNYYFSCQIHTLLQLIPWLLCGWVSDTEGAGRWDEIFSIIPHSDHTENGRKTPPHLKLDSSQHCKSCILGKKLHLQILSFPWDVNFY